MMRYNAVPKGRIIAARFMIDAALGHGRSSTVYKGLDLQTKTAVALKVLDPFLAQDPTSLERFRREVEILRSVQHPNVIKLYEVLKDGEFCIICMEYFDGTDAKSHLTRNGRMPMAEFLRVAPSVVSAVAACHKLKVLHRDLKPQNILINAHKDIKLVDFGIAKMTTMSDLTKTGTVLGTPEYMAPELFLSTRADPRSDIYALGAIFYEFLSGRPPYIATSLSTIMAQQISSEIPPLATFRQDVPDWLEAIVRKCLHVDPNDRYQSCYELQADLRRRADAAALFEQRNEAAVCLNCRTALIRGLVFCHNCGKFSAEVYQKGAHSLVLYRCDDPKGLCDYLTRNFPGTRRAALEVRLCTLPVPIVGGISRDGALSLGNELTQFGCERQVTDKLPATFKLPRIYGAFFLLPLAPLFLMGTRTPLLLIGAATAAAAGVLLQLYRQRIAPLISLDPRHCNGQRAADDTVLQIVARLKRISDVNLKTILGHAANSFLRLRSLLQATPCGIDAGALQRLVFMALDAARGVESYEVYLSSRSLNDIKAKLDAVVLRSRHSRDVDELDGFVRTQVTLEQEFRNYLAIQDLHASTYGALLNLNALLKSIEDALATGSAAAEAAGDLRQIEADLSAACAGNGQS